MLTKGSFWAGVLVGVGGVYVYHRWAKPMATKS